MTASVQHSSRLLIFNILRSLFKNMKIFPISSSYRNMVNIFRVSHILQLISGVFRRVK